jgi:hypothetical protein
MESGTVVLASQRELRQQRRNGLERRLDLRFTRLLDFILTQVTGGVRRIVFEDVIFAGSQAQTQLWASLRAAIWAIASQKSVEVQCVPVATLKVFATSNGSAGKTEMAQALAQSKPDRYSTNPTNGVLGLNGRNMDDNEVDAVWLAIYVHAVDLGNKAFLGVHQRKLLKKERQREKRRQLKDRLKRRIKAQRIEQQVRRRAVNALVKSAGKCCGVFRQLTPYGRAVCPKCRRDVRIPKLSRIEVKNAVEQELSRECKPS